MLTKLALMSKQKNPLDFSRGFRQKSLVFKPVQEMGLEPTRSHPRQILSSMGMNFYVFCSRRLCLFPCFFPLSTPCYFSNWCQRWCQNLLSQYSLVPALSTALFLENGIALFPYSLKKIQNNFNNHFHFNISPSPLYFDT